MRKNSLLFKNYGIKVLQTLATVIIALLAVFALFRMFFAINYFRVYVVGTSMEGTLMGAESKYSAGGDYVYAFKSSNPRRGDIVVIKTERKDEPIIKRVIALGGDRVELREGVLYLNGVKVDEPYVDSKNNTPSLRRNTFAEITVPEGEIFFMGDNRNVSVDSRPPDPDNAYDRTYGTKPVTEIEGIVADWSMNLKGAVTAFNTFFEFNIFKTANR